MPARTGIANLPLHGGRAPRWLFERMSRLAPAVVEAIVLERGPEEVLRRLSDPWWFQAFGCVLGFDWHSSGVTTTVCGALKVGLADRGGDVGVWVAGGKGKASRKTPDELEETAGRLSLDGAELVRKSRTAAAVDSSAVQDGFQLYHHVFFLTSAGGWAVVQQGMRDTDGQARRYHWLGERVRDPVEEPHAAVCSDDRGSPVLNLVAADSAGSRRASVELSRESPVRVLREAKRIASSLDAAGTGSWSKARRRSAKAARGEQLGLFESTDSAVSTAEEAPGRGSGSDVGVMTLPTRHPVVTAEDVNPRHLHKILTATWEAEPGTFEELLGVRGVGARGVRALALLSEVLYGEPASLRDPARFSFAHGGKDGHPHPVDRQTYDRSIHYLRKAVDRARVGRTDRVKALKRLAAWESETPLFRSSGPPATGTCPPRATASE